MIERIPAIITWIKKLCNIRIVRYGIVGGIGIPVHDLALYLFLRLMGNSLYPLALACAFEVSTTINFLLNQLYTYNEQKHLRGWAWVTRALKAQLTSLSALGLSYIIALILVYVLHVNYFIASPVGIICTFFYNFAVSNRFVFRPAPMENAEKAPTSPTESTVSVHDQTGAIL